MQHGGKSARNGEGEVMPRRGKIAAVLHRQPGSTGAIGQWLVAQGYELDIRRPKFGDRLPENLESYAGAIVFGGPNSANDTDDYIRAEIDWVCQAMAQKVPYLGVCLGGQMLALALGGCVEQHSEGYVERGYYGIKATAEGKSFCGDWPSHVYQWHREGFDLPETVTALAGGDEVFPNQAFMAGPSIIGLQFHPEITYMLINRWSRREAQLEAPGAFDRPTHFQQHMLYGPAVRGWLGRCLARWLESDLRK